ncbi:MAG TPA: hypothetical protein VGQ80_08975, partial [Acidimicrobiia bacterium]|nr:hypothetical protein [Acidimicrobiia bacterium]
CAERRAELAAARAALAGTPVEPLDELTRRRLVAAALGAAGDAAPSSGRSRPGTSGGSRWARRHPAFVGSAAAVVLAVLVGVPFVVGHGGSQAQRTLSAAAPAPEAALQSDGAFYGDLGDLSDHGRLRLRLSGTPAGSDTGFSGTAPAEPGPSPAGGAAPGTPVPALAPVSGGLAGSSSEAARSSSPSTTLGLRGSGTGSSNAAKSAAPQEGPANGATTSSDAFASDQTASRDRTDADACVAALLNGPARGGRLTGSGTGTFRGRPAIVAAFGLSGGTVAFVADRAGCAVLDHFSL